MTRTEKIVRYLQANGFREDKSPSRKYRLFTWTLNGNESRYWLGRNGAVRTGRTVAASVSITGAVNGAIAAQERLAAAISLKIA